MLPIICQLSGKVPYRLLKITHPILQWLPQYNCNSHAGRISDLTSVSHNCRQSIFLFILFFKIVYCDRRIDLLPFFLVNSMDDTFSKTVTKFSFSIMRDDYVTFTETITSITSNRKNNFITFTQYITFITWIQILLFLGTFIQNITFNISIQNITVHCIHPQYYLHYVHSKYYLHSNITFIQTKY